MNSDVEARKLAIEVIATLTYRKSDLRRYILTPAGLEHPRAAQILDSRDPISGQRLTKREAAGPLLDLANEVIGTDTFVRALIHIAANWSRFELANDEMVARATVQKARELLDIIKLMDEREAMAREAGHQEKQKAIEIESAGRLRRELELLVMAFDEMAVSTDKQRRGYLLEHLLNRMFDVHEIPVVAPFTRNGGAEQIDGAFTFQNWRFLVECKWQERLSNLQDLDSLTSKVSRSGKPAMGLFLSVQGWSPHVVGALKQNPQKAVMLMDGYDVRAVLDQTVGLVALLNAKIDCLSVRSEPYFSAATLGGSAGMA